MGTLNISLNEAKLCTVNSSEVSDIKALKKTDVVFFGETSDPCSSDQQVEATSERIKTILLDSEAKIRVLSNSGKIVELAEKLKALKNRISYGMSVGICKNSHFVFEKGCLPYDERIKILHRLQDNGLKVFALIHPILPSDSDSRIKTIIEKIRPKQCEKLWFLSIVNRSEVLDSMFEAFKRNSFRDEAAGIKTIQDSSDNWIKYCKRTFLIVKNAVKTKRFYFVQHMKPTEKDKFEHHPSLIRLEARTMDENERQKYINCNDIVVKSNSYFLKIGKALFNIRNEKLFREEFNTFREYVEARFPIGKSYAYDLTNGYSIYQHIAKADVQPTSVKQVLPLHQISLKMTDKDRTAIANIQYKLWNKGCVNGKVPTASIMQNIVDEYLAKQTGSSGNTESPTQATKYFNGFCSWITRLVEKLNGDDLKNLGLDLQVLKNKVGKLKDLTEVKKQELMLSVIENINRAM